MRMFVGIHVLESYKKLGHGPRTLQNLRTVSKQLVCVGMYFAIVNLIFKLDVNLLEQNERKKNYPYHKKSQIEFELYLLPHYFSKISIEVPPIS